MRNSRNSSNKTFSNSCFSNKPSILIDNWQEWLDQPYKLELHRTQRGLDRISALLEKLGHPEKKFRSIHVAGTNGKGSVCAMLAQILHCAGVSIGRYTSPHLYNPVERVWINGNSISYEEWKEFGNEVFTVAESCPEWPSPFEFMTAMGFLAFARAKVDIAVVEVGIGGRLDATNVVSPIVTVITSIGHDHCGVLGNNLISIAKEKAGIIKRGCQVVCGPVSPRVFKVICGEAAMVGVPVLKATSVKECKNDTESYGSLRFVVQGATWESALTGEFQRINIGIVFEVLELLKKQGVRVGNAAIKDGLLQVVWPGRFEIVSKDPLIILDGTHNPHGMNELVKSLNKLNINGSRVMLLGISRDKNTHDMLRIAKQWATYFVFTSASSLRSLEPGKLKSKLGQFCGEVIIADTLRQGILNVLSLMSGDDCLVVAGSLFLVGEAKELLDTILLKDNPKEGVAPVRKIFT